MNLPNVIIIGAQKSGTSALFNWMSQHPDVFGNEIMKDYPYYGYPENERHGKKWFSQFYSGRQKEKVILHGFVNYLYFSEISAKAIHSAKKDAKLICVLRNPIDRAYSAFWQSKKMGYDFNNSFEKALEKETDYLTNFSDDYKIQNNNTYVDHGYYSRQIKDFLKYFDKDNLKIILFEDMINDRESVMKSIFQFMEVDDSFIPENKRVNDAGIPRSPLFQKLIVKFTIPGFIKKFIPPSLRYNAINFLKRANVKRVQYPKLKPETRRHLSNIYRTEIDELAALIGRDLSSWKE